MAMRLGVGLGVDQAGIAVAPCAADARAPVAFRLVEEHAARGVERVVPALVQVFEQLLDAGSCDTAGHG